MNLTNSTVSGNSASDGGGIYSDGTVNLTNSIIANQLAGEDCSGDAPATSNNYNLDSDGSCYLYQPNDKPYNPNANLGPLQLNAPGNTATHALLPGSDAIDTGDCSGGTITDDQRGVSRPQDGDNNGSAICDIGAYELWPGIIVEKQTDPDGATESFEFSPNYGSNFSLSDGQSNHSAGSLTPGDYSVSEIIPAGWRLDSIICVTNDSANPSPVVNIPGVTIDLDPSEEVICTFTNTRIPVGGSTILPNQLLLFAPWIGLAALVSLAALTVASARRRRA